VVAEAFEFVASPDSVFSVSKGSSESGVSLPMLGYLMAKLGLLCVQSAIEVLCTAWIHVGILVMAVAKVGSAAAAGNHFVT